MTRPVPTWTPRGYHVLTHTNTSEVMLGTNAVPRVAQGACFTREGQALHWQTDPQVPHGWSFNDLPDTVWAAIAEGRCFLVEFGPNGPLTEHDVLLSSDR